MKKWKLKRNVLRYSVDIFPIVCPLTDIFPLFFLLLDSIKMTGSLPYFPSLSSLVQFGSLETQYWLFVTLAQCPSHLRPALIIIKSFRDLYISQGIRRQDWEFLSIFQSHGNLCHSPLTQTIYIYYSHFLN